MALASPRITLTCMLLSQPPLSKASAVQILCKGVIQWHLPVLPLIKDTIQ
jgi:hypothetical protein